MRSAYLDNHNWKTLRMSYAFHFMIIDRMATRFVQPEIKLIITQRKDDFPKRTNCVILHTKYTLLTLRLSLKLTSTAMKNETRQNILRHRKMKMITIFSLVNVRNKCKLIHKPLENLKRRILCPSEHIKDDQVEHRLSCTICHIQECSNKCKLICL